MEAFLDVAHPDAFVHLRNESTALARDTPAPDILLSSLSPVLSSVAGYSSLGSLYAGTGYWSRETSMPAPLTDHKVRPSGRRARSPRCCAFLPIPGTVGRLARAAGEKMTWLRGRRSARRGWFSGGDAAGLISAVTVQAITVDNKMYIFGGADWVTQSAIKRMWVYDHVLQVSHLRLALP